MTVSLEGDTREALLDAAEALFAAEGIENVSLAAITRLAGQRNGGAIHYHFGGRDGLLAAILDRHEAVLDEIRMNALIESRRSGPVTVEALARVSIEPLAGRLESATGRSFLAIQRNRLVKSGGSWNFRSTTMRLVVAETQALISDRGFDEAEQAERIRLVTQLVIHRLADRSREETLKTTTPRTLVIETLVSAATSILTGEQQQ
jgi:AcrR family transcriptional regulator